MGILVLVAGGGCRKTPQKNSDQGPLRPLLKVKGAVMPQLFQGVEAALEQYRDEHDRYPDQLSELVPAFLTRADDLIDSWGTPMRLRTDNSTGEAILESAGPDRQFGTPDDLVRRQ